MFDELNIKVEDDKRDIPLKFYEIAHAEILTRLRIRNGALMAYLAAAGVIFGIGFKEKEYLIFYIIPFLSLGCAIIFSHHNTMITGLLDYTEKLFIPNNVNKDSYRFELSKSSRFIDTAYQKSIGSYLILTLIPSAAAICLIWYKLPQLNTANIILLSVSCACLYFSQKRIYNSYRERYRKTANKEILIKSMINCFRFIKFLEHMIIFRRIIYPVRLWLIKRAGRASGNDDIHCNFVKAIDGNTIIVDIPAWPKVIGERIAVRVRGVDATKISVYDISDIRGFKSLECPYKVVRLLKGYRNNKKKEDEYNEALEAKRVIEHLCNNGNGLKLRKIKNSDLLHSTYDGYFVDFGFVVADVILENEAADSEKILSDMLIKKGPAYKVYDRSELNYPPC